MMRGSLFSWLACLALLFCPSLASARPNIVLILADDLGYGDLGCYGQRLIRTPNIDRLAAEGLRFTQAYAGSTVCAPSRCSLMTGKHNGHNRVRDNLPHGVFLRDEDVTLAEVLRAAGYRTGGIGKWSLGDAGTPGRATKQGFDMWLGYLNQDDAHFYYPPQLDDGEGTLSLPGNRTGNPAKEGKKEFSPDLLTARALEFIRESKDRPFFLYAAYTPPHFSHKSEDPTQYPVPTDEPYGSEAWDQRSKNYAALVTRLDRDVGRIVGLIDELGLQENTLILFTSDNGAYVPTPPGPDIFQSSGPLRGHKRDLYEGGIRVPLIARWPGHVPAGRTSAEIIPFWDLLPTLAELAETQPPPGIDGRLAADALRGGKRGMPPEYLYWDYGHTREKYAQAVRLGNWKGVRTSAGSPLELYDLAADPGETQNVAIRHPEVVAKIEEIMKSAVVPSPDYAPIVKTGN